MGRHNVEDEGLEDLKNQRTSNRAYRSIPANNNGTPGNRRIWFLWINISLNNYCQI